MRIQNLLLGITAFLFFLENNLDAASNTLASRPDLSGLVSANSLRDILSNIGESRLMPKGYLKPLCIEDPPYLLEHSLVGNTHESSPKSHPSNPSNLFFNSCYPEDNGVIKGDCLSYYV